MPFFCDMLGIILLILALWWIRKFGAVTVTGIIATVITLMLNPYATHFFGFTTASVVFDIVARLIGYQNCLEKPILSVISLLLTSITSTAIAGIVIGNLFMNPAPFGGVAFFSVLHAAGGAIGGTIGIVLIKALSTRISLQRFEK